MATFVCPFTRPTLRQKMRNFVAVEAFAQSPLKRPFKSGYFDVKTALWHNHFPHICMLCFTNGRIWLIFRAILRKLSKSEKCKRHGPKRSQNGQKSQKGIRKVQNYHENDMIGPKCLLWNRKKCLKLSEINAKRPTVRWSIIR